MLLWLPFSAKRGYYGASATELILRLLPSLVVAASVFRFVTRASLSDLKGPMGTTAPTKLLVICTANRLRSKTLEAMLARTPGFEVRSAGTHPHGHGRPITRTDIRWADRLVIFEPFHRRELLRRFFPLARTKPIVDFAIPDEYPAFDPALIALLKERFALYFETPLADPSEGQRDHACTSNC